MIESFKNDLPFNIQSLRWKKTFNDILHKCFNKVRIVKKKSLVKYDNLLKERMILKKEIRSGIIDEELRTKIKQKIEAIEESIGDKAVQENFRTIVETV